MTDYIDEDEEELDCILGEDNVDEYNKDECPYWPSLQGVLKLVSDEGDLDTPEGIKKWQWAIDELLNDFDPLIDIEDLTLNERDFYIKIASIKLQQLKGGDVDGTNQTRNRPPI